MKSEQLYLKPDEGKFLAMAIVAVLEDIRSSAKNVNYNWTPETRKDLKDMIAAGTSLRIKLQRLGFNMENLPPYVFGDENDFLTKQS